METPIGDDEDSHWVISSKIPTSLHPVDASASEGLKQQTRDVLSGFNLTERSESLENAFLVSTCQRIILWKKLGKQFDVTRERIRRN